MAFINLVNKYGSYMIVFMLIETFILTILLINSIFGYLTIKRLKKMIKEVLQ